MFCGNLIPNPNDSLTMDVEAQAPEKENDQVSTEQSLSSKNSHRPEPNTSPRYDARKRGLKDRDEVWTHYLTESQRRDAETLEACDKNMDVLLIFAGLFSGVLTAFTVISYTQLQPNPQTHINAILETILSQLRASGSTNNTTTLPVSLGPPPAAVRLNVLWFSSLTCSLLAALGAVMAKQWVVEFPRGAAPSATPCELAQHRQIRFTGMTTWHFQRVIDSLPFLIHASFGLFLIGLCDFLSSLSTIVGSVVTVLCVLGYFFIISSQIAAMIYPSCPFRTTLSTSLSKARHSIGKFFTKITFGPVAERYNLWYHPTGWRAPIIKGWKKLRYSDSERVGDIPRWALNTATLAENDRLNLVNAQALAWLMHWAADEDVVVTISSLIPTLPASDLRAPLVDALPRLCTLFQSYFLMDDDMNSSCPIIVPRIGHDEKIKTLGRAIHRIMLGYPNGSLAGRATRVIGDVFGDSFLVFPPHDVHDDIHALVCSLFTADPSYHRRYSQAVQEQLFISLLGSHAISPWALTMILDSLCTYIATGTQTQRPPLSLQSKRSLLSHILEILPRAHRMVELSSALGLTINVLFGGTLSPGDLQRDKAECLPRNLLIAIRMIIEEIHKSPPSLLDRHFLQSSLMTLLRAFQDFAADQDLKISFHPVRLEVLTLLCRILSQEITCSPATLVAAISVIDCYPDDRLPLAGGDVIRALSSVLQQIGTVSAIGDIKSILHLVSRLIDLEGETMILPPLSNFNQIGTFFVNILNQEEADDARDAVLQSFARHAGFWLRNDELLGSLQAAGINATIITILSRHYPESHLLLTLVIADHLARALPLPLFQADPELVAIDSILRRHDLEPYTHHLCITVALRLIQHLPTNERGRVLDKSDIISFATSILVADDQVGDYVIEDWCMMTTVIARTHRTKLSDCGFLDALQSAARAHGIAIDVDSISELYAQQCITHSAGDCDTQSIGANTVLFSFGFENMDSWRPEYQGSSAISI